MTKKWDTVRELLPSKKTHSNIHNFDDVEAKADEFNEYFANVGKGAFESTQKYCTNVNVIAHDYANENITNKFRPQPVTVETVILTFKQLNETNAVGADDIAFRFIKDSLVVLAFYYTIIINTSIVTGIYPTLWKYCLVPPVLKSGDANDVSNYRPIAILPVLSKLLEKIVANQLRDYLENNHLISDTQHGFRKGRSTESALIKVTDKIYNNIDNNKISLLVLCDLSKAFDSIHHDYLLRKFDDHSIDYLADRMQSVKIGKHISSKK